MTVQEIPVSRVVLRAIEAVLAAWITKDAFLLYLGGKHDAAINNALIAATVVAVVEGGLWLIPRLVKWAYQRWGISSDEVFFRIIQVLILAAMVADGAAWLITGTGFGVNQPGCLIALVALEGVIRRFVRPDPRPLEMARALGQLRAQVRVFTQLPPEQVKASLGLVRGLSDIEASSRRDFELAEQEALYAMLKEARALGANAVIDARLTTGTYETAGSQWQVSRPVYTGTAVRI
jgi:uncharacterized protein YbjQ (UPF0145 family)